MNSALQRSLNFIPITWEATTSNARIAIVEINFRRNVFITKHNNTLSLGEMYSISLDTVTYRACIPAVRIEEPFSDQCSASTPLSPNGLMSLNSIAHCPGITKSHFCRAPGYCIGEARA